MYDFKRITMEDLNFRDDDFTDCKVSLSDYGWSTYTIKIQLALKDNTFVIVEEEYTLFNTSDFKLKHIEGDTVEELTFVGDSDWVIRHLTQQFESHIKNFESDECPTNTELCLNQYNEIVDLYRIVEANLPKRRTYLKGEEND